MEELRSRDCHAERDISNIPRIGIKHQQLVLGQNPRCSDRQFH